MKENRIDLNDQPLEASSRPFWLWSIPFVTALYLISFQNYLLFHGLAEGFSVAIAFCMFILAWNSRQFTENHFLLFLGLTYAFVGFLDLIHTFAYKGMGIFPDQGANPATQLWIAARYLQSISLLLAPIWLKRKLPVNGTVACLALYVCLVLAAVFYWHIFPDCFVEGAGLTTFKIYSEYAICLILFTALAAIWKQKDLLNRQVTQLVCWSIAFTIVAELAFTFYVSVYGLSNAIGHLFKIVSFYLIYKAIIENTIRKPYTNMFRKLKDSEFRYRQIFETNQAVKLLIDPQDGSIVEANEAAVQFYGYSKDEILTKKITDINTLPPEEVHREMARAESENRLFFNFPHRLASGEMRDVEVHSGPVKTLDRTLLYSIIHDVTERKETEEKLRESENRWRSLAESSPDHILLLDRNLQIGFANYAAPGLQVDDLIGTDITDYLQEERKAEIRSILTTVLKDGEPARYETTYQAPDGQRIYYESVVIPRKSDNRVIGLTLSAREVTERKKAEAALEESEDRFRTLYENAPMGYQSLDKNGRLIEANQTWLRLMGYRRKEVIGKYFAGFLSAKSANGFPEIFSQFKNIGKIAGIEFEMIRKDGSLFLAALSGKIQRYEDETFKQTHTVLQDITMQKRAEAEKARLEEQLRQSQKMEAIGTLAGGIAHDFNNILAIISGNTELAMDDVPDWNPARENLEEIQRASLRARDVVRQILSFSRRSETETRTVDMASVVTESLQLLRASIPTSIEIRKNIEKDVRTISGNSTQIHQIMINLCTNGTHAMEQEGGILEIDLHNVEVKEKDDSLNLELGNYVKLTVRDNGEGIEPALIERIFDPYFTTKDVGKGTGMGLAVVHGIVLAHGGAIRVESDAGKGTKFHLFFPVAEGKAETEGENHEKLPTGTETILFVDDEKSLAKMGKQMLERLGYLVEAKTDPAEALELFRTNPKQIDLIITDMTMPGISGDRLAEKLLEIRADIPIIISTGYSEYMDETKSMNMGIKALLEKPLSLKHLAQTVRKVLDTAKRAEITGP